MQLTKSAELSIVRSWSGRLDAERGAGWSTTGFAKPNITAQMVRKHTALMMASAGLESLLQIDRPGSGSSPVKPSIRDVRAQQEAMDARPIGQKDGTGK